MVSIPIIWCCNFVQLTFNWLRLSHCEVGLMKMWRKCVKAFVRTDDVRFSDVVTFEAYHKICADAF